MVDQFSRRLTAEEFSVLRWHGEGLATGHTDLESVVAVARVYRTRGLSWVEIAAGNAKPGGNDFAVEAAEIRARLTPHGVDITERFNIELPELRRELDALRPAVLHLAAHCDFGGLWLSLDNTPSKVLIEDLGHVIRDSAHQPRLVVLNCCHTEYLADTLTRTTTQPFPAAAAAIGWRGAVNDEQARCFVSQLYRFAAGRNLRESFADAQLAITARWPDQALPRLFGHPQI